MNKMIAYLWEGYHAGRGITLAGKAYQTFEVLALVNTVSYDAYGLAVEMGLIDDQPAILSLN